MYTTIIIRALCFISLMYYGIGSYCSIEFITIETFLNDSIAADTVPPEKTPELQKPRGRVKEITGHDTIEVYKAIETISNDTIIDDTPYYIEAEVEERTDTKEEAVKHSPTKAAMLSATLPGLGQIYNKKYWKVPIVYAGFGVVIYFINFNNTEYQKWRKAYYYRVDGNPNTVDDFPNHSTDILNRAMNYYRRNLEIAYIAGGIIYLLGILDATVDAHLFTFDVSEDLSIYLQPGITPVNYGHNNRAASGITISFRF